MNYEEFAAKKKIVPDKRELTNYYGIGEESY